MINKEHFFVIAGDCSELDGFLLEDDPYHSLSFQQEEQYDEGRRSAEIVWYRSYFLVMSGTLALDEKHILLEPKEKTTLGSMYECLKWGIEWANKDLLNREFYMRIPSTLETEDK